MSNYSYTANDMGTPDNGFRKPFRPAAQRNQAPMTVRQAVTKWGDDWRLMMDQQSPYKHEVFMETVTRDGWEAADMVHMERGLLGRIR